MLARSSSRRWAWLLGYAFVGSALAPSFGAWLCIFVGAVVPESVPFAGAVHALILGALLLLATRLLKPRVGHFCGGRWVRFPPLVTALPLALGLCLALAGVERWLVDAGSMASGSWLATAAALALFIVLVIVPLAVRGDGARESLIAPDAAGPKAPAILEGRRDRAGTEGAATEGSQSEIVRAWLRAEAPIRSPGQDLFDAGARATRILEALLTRRGAESSGDFCQTVVIQGPFGSGKSSLVELVEAEARRRRRDDLLFVPLNCWGFEPGTRLIEHVLEECVARLHERVDCTTIRSAPTSYARALAAGTNEGIFGLAQTLFGSETSPTEQIQRFGPILEASRVRLIAVIEDTDRNGQSFDAGQIESLLHQFRNVSRMSFILSAGSGSRIEFPKVAEHIEFIPPMRKDAALALLDVLRSEMLADGSWIDPTALSSPYPGNRQRNRPASLAAEGHVEVLALRMWGAPWPKWVTAVGALLQTPRSLKVVGRTFSEVWQRMRGEIDVDELLMALALRHAAPAVFSFIGRNLAELQSLRRDGDGKDGAAEKRIQELRDEWRDIQRSATYPANAALVILAELFPKGGILLGLQHFDHGNRVQSVRHEDGPAYWDRITSEALSPHEPRDQAVLSVLVAATRAEGDAKPLAVLMDDGGAASLVAYFVNHTGLVNGSEERILSALLDRMRSQHGRRASGDHPAYQQARLSVGKNIYHDDARVQRWLTAELRACFPRHLRLACDLFTDFARLTPAEIQLREALCRLARETFTGATADLLADALDPTYPWTISHLLFAYRRGPADRMLTRGQDWDFIVPLLLDGITRHPATVGVSTLLAFFVVPELGVAAQNCDFRHDEVRDFFGERAEEFFRLAAAFDTDAPNLPDIRTLLAAIKPRASLRAQMDDPLITMPAQT